MPSSELLTREYPVGDLQIRELDDGLTVEGVVVPYGVTAHIIEPRPGGEVIEYDELFEPGSFQRAIENARRVPLLYSHTDVMSNWMGRGDAFADTPDGLLGTFRLAADTAAHAREILSTSHAAFSVSFRSISPRPFSERAGQLVRRRSAHLAHVAAVPVGAYSGAGVTAIRAAGDELAGEQPTANELADAEAAEQQRQLLEWIAEAKAGQQRWQQLVSS